MRERKKALFSTFAMLTTIVELPISNHVICGIDIDVFEGHCMLANQRFNRWKSAEMAPVCS